MNPCTAEIIEVPEDIYRKALEEEKRIIIKGEEFIPLEKDLVSQDEIQQGFANFKTWCEALGLKLTTRQTRRKAERRYAKALKKLKEGKSNV